jgi:hypothetical protein
MHRDATSTGVYPSYHPAIYAAEAEEWAGLVGFDSVVIAPVDTLSALGAAVFCYHHGGPQGPAELARRDSLGKHPAS